MFQRRAQDTWNWGAGGAFLARQELEFGPAQEQENCTSVLIRAVLVDGACVGVEMCGFLFFKHTIKRLFKMKGENGSELSNTKPLGGNRGLNSCSGMGRKIFTVTAKTKTALHIQGQ